MTLKLSLAFVLAFIIALIVGRFYIPWLRKMKAGQEIKEIGPSWHMAKTGTPTMGGFIFIFAAAVVCLTVGFSSMRNGDYAHIFILLFALVFGAIGFLDDWEKLRKKQNLGLSAKAKFLLQLVAALVFVLLMRKLGYLSTHLYIPFWNVEVPIPDAVYFILAAFIIVGTVNAVNITDGVDGLASGTSIPVFFFYTVVAFLWGERYLSLGIFSSAMLGGLLVFLVFNFNPAKVFMGDTGSMFIGGAVVGMAMLLRQPFLLLLIGFTCCMSSVSVILQRYYYKATRKIYGTPRRLFKMSPLHHHFEKCGMKETQIVLMYTVVTLVLTALAVISVIV